MATLVVHIRETDLVAIRLTDLNQLVSNTFRVGTPTVPHRAGHDVLQDVLGNKASQLAGVSLGAMR
jgi:hypothetical protein